MRTGREALEKIDTHRLVVGLRGYSAILRDVAELLEDSDEKTDILFVADRLERSVPEFEKRIGQRVSELFVRKNGNSMRYNKNGDPE